MLFFFNLLLLVSLVVPSDLPSGHMDTQVHIGNMSVISSHPFVCIMTLTLCWFLCT
jgi:hypothetical protein